MKSYIIYNVYFNIPISEKEEEIKFTFFIVILSINYKKSKFI